MFSGFVSLEANLADWLLVLDANGAPYNADVVPSFKVFGPSGVLAAAAGVSAVTPGENGLYRATISALAARGFAAGETYRVVYYWAQSAAARQAIHTFTVT